MFQTINAYPCNKDDGVRKKSVSEGAGLATPGLGYNVHISYRETLKDGTLIKDAYDKVYQFRMSKFELSEALIISIGSMRKGETAEFMCLPKYCYGKDGKPPYVPPNAVMLYKITLHDFTGRNFNLKLDEQIKKTMIKPGRSHYTPSLAGCATIKFTASYNGQVFDNPYAFGSRLNTSTLVLGKSENIQIPEGIAIALKDFKPEEKSELVLKSKYAFGAEGHSKFCIPPYAEVKYVIELVEFNFPNETEEKINEAKDYIKQAEDFYKNRQYILAMERYRKVINWLEGDYDYEDLDQLKKKDNLLLISYLNLAACYLKAERPGDALYACDGALIIDIKNEVAYYRKALAYLSQKEYANEHQFEDLTNHAKKCLWLATKTKSTNFNSLVDTDVVKSEMLKKLTLESLWSGVKTISEIDLIMDKEPRVKTEKDRGMEGIEDFKKRLPFDIDNLAQYSEDVEVSNPLANNPNPVNISPTNCGGICKKIIRKGTGDKTPGIGCSVKIHYTSYLINGTKIDTSKNKKPFEFDIGTSKVIKAWDFAVKTMKKGEIASLICSRDYACGTKSMPFTKYPPNSALRFEIELLDWIEGGNPSLDEDKSVEKIQVKAGKGSSKPTYGGFVNVHVVGKYNYREFDKRHVEFRLGDGVVNNIVEGIEIALKYFNVGEISRLKIKSKHAFGSDGNEEFGIPPNADVEYTVILKNFENDLSINSLDGAQKLEKAKVFKEKGTSNFKKRRIVVALKMYEKALECLNRGNDFKGKTLKARNNLLFTCYSNLAQCFLEINSPLEAKNAAVKALEIDPTNEKALFRRGKAYLSLDSPEVAVKDFQEILNINPKCQEAADKFSDCEKLISEKFCNLKF